MEFVARIHRMTFFCNLGIILHCDIIRLLKKHKNTFEPHVIKEKAEHCSIPVKFIFY